MPPKPSKSIPTPACLTTKSRTISTRSAMRANETSGLIDSAPKGEICAFHASHAAGANHAPQLLRQSRSMADQIEKKMANNHAS